MNHRHTNDYIPDTITVYSHMHADCTMKPTEQEVTIAIKVLRSYIDGTLETHQCDELDDCIAKAWDILMEETYDEYSEDELLDYTPQIGYTED